MRANERGQSLVDAVIAAAVASIAVAAVLSALVAATHRFGAVPVEEALRTTVQRELRVAADVLKYQGSSIAPVTIATSAPLPGGSPLPIHLSISTSPVGTGGSSVTITASADGRSESATVTTTVPAPVPLPSARIIAPQGGSAPI